MIGFAVPLRGALRGMNLIRRARGRRSIACLCIVVVLVAALMPGAATLDYAIPEPGWVLLPDLATPSESTPSLTFVGSRAAVVPSLPGRAPPTLSLRS